MGFVLQLGPRAHTPSCTLLPSRTGGCAARGLEDPRELVLRVRLELLRERQARLVLLLDPGEPRVLHPVLRGHLCSTSGRVTLRHRVQTRALPRSSVSGSLAPLENLSTFRRVPPKPALSGAGTLRTSRHASFPRPFQSDSVSANLPFDCTARNPLQN